MRVLPPHLMQRYRSGILLAGPSLSDLRGSCAPWHRGACARASPGSGLLLLVLRHRDWQWYCG